MSGKRQNSDGSRSQLSRFSVQGNLLNAVVFCLNVFLIKFLPSGPLMVYLLKKSVFQSVWWH